MDIPMIINKLKRWSLIIIIIIIISSYIAH